MRAFRKTSIYASHDFVVHFMADEVARLLEELECLDIEAHPNLTRLNAALGKVFDRYESEAQNA